MEMEMAFEKKNWQFEYGANWGEGGGAWVEGSVMAAASVGERC